MDVNYNQNILIAILILVISSVSSLASDNTIVIEYKNIEGKGITDSDALKSAILYATRKTEKQELSGRDELIEKHSTSESIGFVSAKVLEYKIIKKTSLNGIITILINCKVSVDRAVINEQLAYKETFKNLESEINISEIDGYGSSQDNAVKNALLNAIKFVCGEHIQVKDLYLNDHSTEYILNLSQGYITNYIIKDVRKNDSLYHVVIDCMAKKSSRGLIGLDRTGKEINVKDIWANLFSIHNNKNDAYEYLKAILPRMNKDLYIIEPFLLNNTNGNRSYLEPIVLDSSWRNLKNRVGFAVCIRPDLELWKNSFEPLLEKAFGVLCEYSHDTNVNFEQVSGENFIKYITPKEKNVSLGSYNGLEPCYLLNIPKSNRTKLSLSRISRSITLDIKQDMMMNTSTLRTYVFDTETWNNLKPVLEGIQSIILEITVLDREEKRLCKTELLGNSKMVYKTYYRSKDSNSNTLDPADFGLIYIGPRLTCRDELNKLENNLIEFSNNSPVKYNHYGDYDVDFYDNKLLMFELTLNDEEIQKINIIKFNIK